MKYLTLVFAASITVTGAYAQTSSSTTTTTTTTSTGAAAPRHNCVRPEIIDMSKKITEAQMAAFVAALNKYKECSEGYAQTQQKEAERVQKEAQVTAQALVAAGNVAIKEYNDFVEEASKVMHTKAPTQPKAPTETREQGSIDVSPSRIPKKN